MAPDLLHQVIKGTFKDHLVEWVMQHLHQEHGEARTVEIITDIDWWYISGASALSYSPVLTCYVRISAVPIFPGLRRFQDGRNFAQWTGDDSKALMKVCSPSLGIEPCTHTQQGIPCCHCRSRTR